MIDAVDAAPRTAAAAASGRVPPAAAISSSTRAYAEVRLRPKSPSPERRSSSPSRAASTGKVASIPSVQYRPKCGPRVVVGVSSEAFTAASPGQGGGPDGRVPQAEQLVVGRDQRDGHAVHVERGDVGADEGALDPEPLPRHQPVDRAGGDLQLERVGRAQAVDDRDDAASTTELEG